MSTTPDTMDDCRREIEWLRKHASQLTSEIESLNYLADSVECLREIGKLVGCNHVDGDDGRRQLVSCVEQSLDTSARQAAWLRLVAWGLASELLTLGQYGDSVWCGAWRELDDEGNRSGMPLFWGAVSSADGKLPDYNPTLEAALTAAMDSTRSEA